MKLPADKEVFLKTCAGVLIGCTVVGWACGSALWGFFAGIVCCIAIFLWGDA